MPYPVNSKKRGYFLVFGNQQHHSENWAESNRGNEDKAELNSALTALGFDVQYFNDLTTREIHDKIKHYSSAIDHSDRECFGCAFLTRGGRKGILHSKDSTYRLCDIIAPFQRCKSLEDKPKIFFVQAFVGVYHETCARISEEPFDSNLGDVEIPGGPDFIVGYSTAQGSISSCQSYIRVLSDSLLRHRNHDLIETLTKVNEICSANKSQVKQDSTIISRLRYPVYFPPRMGYDYTLGEEEGMKTIRIFSGSLVGHTVTLTGMPTNAQGRFTINFGTDSDQKIYFHFNVRMKERVIVRNNRSGGGKWGGEQRGLLDPFPFAHRVPFKLDIRVTEWCFCVSHDGSRLLSFAHRSKDIEDIRKVSIQMNVQVESLFLT